MKKYFVLFAIILTSYHCTKENTAQPNEISEYTINIEHKAGSTIKDLVFNPHYPDSIRISFTSTDTSQYVAYRVNRTLPTPNYYCYFNQDGNRFSALLVFYSDSNKDCFYRAKYQIFKQYIKDFKQDYSILDYFSMADIVLNRNK